jgi:CRP/FNR family transcriptional regulator, cyclic AMP receptor protein
MRPRYVRLLEVEPSLGAGLTRHELDEARRLAVAPVVTLPAGHWEAGQLPRTLETTTFGCMIVDGLIAHELALEGRAATYLLGPGDLLAPTIRPSGLLPVSRSFGVADDASLAVLDEAIPAVAQRWPSIAGRLLVQAQRQLERLAVQQVISHLPRADHRIVAMLWHLAERWGSAVSDGVVVPLTLPHEVISRFVGGRRPTVSAALSALAGRGLVVRLPNGTWLLAPESRALLVAAPAPAPVARVHLRGTSGRRGPLATAIGRT